LLFLAMLAGCGRTPDLEPLPPHWRAPAMELLPVFTQTVNNDIDIVFMIDDSRSMREEQENLRRNFPAFTRLLKDLPQGLPNVHIAVVSSDLGAGPETDIDGCAPGGKGGRFQHAARAQGGLCGAVPRGSFISAVGGVQNFDGDIDQVLGCIAELGTTGCGFEHQLASLRRALDPAGAPRENAGFLREEAALAIIMLTDEDDCSAPADTDLFAQRGGSRLDPQGPLSSFRCAEFGHRCGGRRPPRSPAGPLEDCRSAEDGVLVPVADLVEFLRSLKSDPDDVMVAAVAGPETPYRVSLERIENSTELRPVLDPSCTSANGAAAPAVRIHELVEAFGAAGSFFSICADDFSPVMARIGQEISRRVSLECLAGRAADVDLGVEGLQAHCSVYQEVRAATGTERTLIPGCDGSAQPPCWRVESAPKCPTSGQRMMVDRGGAAPPANTRIHVICETCELPGDRRCG
jgi:hypothetical protein